jgi:serine/threonine protein kinase
LKFEEYFETNSSKISLSHPVFDPRKPILLHIQMEVCCQTLNEGMKQLSNELIENDSQNKKTLSYYICCELFTKIIECVDYLHGRNAIHIELKPANILITDVVNGRFVKLADFGLSVANEFIDQSHSQCRETIKFMAPEVFASRKYDMKGDIYSLADI